MGCVYIARNRINNKRYIGKTVRTLARRMAGHRDSAKRNYRPTAFTLALQKYGCDCFEWTVLFEGDDNKELLRVEVAMIAMLQTRSPRGYNLTNGGEGNVGYRASEETRIKLRESHLGQKPSDKCRETAREMCKKRWASEELRAKLGDRWRGNKHNVGRKVSAETRAKLSAIRKGRRLTPEHCARISAAQKGRPGKIPSAETRAKISAAGKGRKHTPETIERMRTAQSRRSPETCAKISATKKANAIAKRTYEQTILLEVA